MPRGSILYQFSRIGRDEARTEFACVPCVPHLGLCRPRVTHERVDLDAVRTVPGPGPTVARDLYRDAQHVEAGVKSEAGLTLIARPMSCAQEYFGVINPYTVGSLTIPRAIIKWVYLW